MARGSNMFPFIWDPPLPFCRYPVGCARIPPFCSSSWYLAKHDGVFFFCLNHDNFASYIFLFLWDNIHNMPWGANVPDPSAAFVLHALYAPLNSLVLTAVFHCFFLNTCNLKNKNYEKRIIGRWETCWFSQEENLATWTSDGSQVFSKWPSHLLGHFQASKTLNCFGYLFTQRCMCQF